jgi:hypothetical protein
LLEVFLRKKGKCSHWRSAGTLEIERNTLKLKDTLTDKLLQVAKPLIVSNLPVAACTMTGEGWIIWSVGRRTFDTVKLGSAVS